jgi:hypothetical protein
MYCFEQGFTAGKFPLLPFSFCAWFFDFCACYGGALLPGFLLVAVVPYPTVTDFSFPGGMAALRSAVPFSAGLLLVGWYSNKFKTF